MALTAAALLQTSCQLVCNLFSRQIGSIFGMLSRRAGLSATAGLSCFVCVCVYCVLLFIFVFVQYFDTVDWVF